MHPQTLRREAPLIMTLFLIGTILGGLLVGYEPVGGDPDRMYRPIKSELARAVGEGRLPFWSERFGLGIPLVAESHVAAFYPPNWVLYRGFDGTTAYRLAMWVHHLALAATTYFYARCLGLVPWGSALAAVAFTLCGFQAIHSSHEPFYHLNVYLPLALGLAERYMATGGLGWLASLPPTLGLQWTLGHFQIQTWTGGLVILTGLWRAGLDRGRLWRALGLIVAVCWGVALAAVQLGLSWQFAGLVGQTKRPIEDLAFYAFPPGHWFEPALPQLVRGLSLGPEDPYWLGQQTTGYEAALYVGTIPLVLAGVGGLGRPSHRATGIWRVLAPLSFAVATMPRWWPWGYQLLLAFPGVGYFRAPARYTLLTCLGLALLAGAGFDPSIARKRFRLGLAGALVFGGCAAIAALLWAARADVHLSARLGGLADGFLWAALAWLLAVVVVLAWRAGRLGSWAPLTAAAIELAMLYYAGTTQWGWSIALPGQSPVLAELARQAPGGLIGGAVRNLPVRAGLATGNPYLGFELPPPNDILERLQRPLLLKIHEPGVGSDPAAMAALARWFRRLRLSHLVVPRRAFPALGTDLGRWRDPGLDQIVYHAAGEPATRAWTIIRLDEPFPEARVAARARTVADRRAVLERLSIPDDREIAWFLAEDRVPVRGDARSARLVSWDGSAALIEHDGPCDLVIARTFDPGWRARVDGGPERTVLPVDGGFQAVRLEGSGTRRVTLRYRPSRLALWSAITLVAAIVNLGLGVGVAAVGARRQGGSRRRAS